MSHELNLEEVVKKAREEINEEKFREQVDKHKAKILAKKSLLSKIFPFRIKIERLH